MTPRPGQRGGESFERYYLRQVAISEGCGCAELVIRRETATPTIRAAAGERRSGASLWRRLVIGLRGRWTGENKDSGKNKDSDA